jgi:DNA invertase Pin-like site-specific DNA recombinase
MTESTRPIRSLGYARVSTVGQTLEAQRDQLQAAGCVPIFRQKASDARADRRELAKLIRALEAGDEVVVTRIDRLARSTFDLFGIVKSIVDAGAQFRSLAEPWTDTGTSTGRLMLAVMGGMTDVERDMIRTRTAEGRTRAKARGVRMGRPPALTPQQQREVVQRLSDGETITDLARSYNVGIATIHRVRKAGQS